MRGPALALSILLLGAAAGCSDDDGGDAQPYIDALQEAFLEDEEEAFRPTEEQAGCFAERTIEAIGVDTIEEAEVTPEELAESDGPAEAGIELSEEQAREAAQAFTGCGLSLAGAFAGEDADDQLVDCVDENLDEDLVVDAFTASYLGNESESDDLFEQLFTDADEACNLLGG